MAAQQTPEVAKEVMALAAAANLITTTLGRDIADLTVIADAVEGDED